jgi:hypothetical protein
MPQTYTPIATFTATGSESAITFSSISSSYTDLRLVVTMSDGSGTAYGVNMRVGDGSLDTTSSYSATRIIGNGTTATSGRQSNQTNWDVTINGLTPNTNELGVYAWDFLNYSNTTTFKSVLGRINVASSYVMSTVSLWRKTNAINTIWLQLGAGAANYKAGSTFTLYGILKA